MKLSLALTSLALAFSAFAQDAVRIDVDPTHYSAGKMSAAEIDKWFADNIKVGQFDIWSGKKDRLYLNGAWKFVSLTGLPARKDWDKIEHGRFDVNLGDSDFGERNGFFKVDFDDSKWFNQPVPLAWSDSFTKNKLTAYPALGWYRKTFTPPDTWKGRRVVLNFLDIAKKSAIYLNGKLLGVHENFRSGHCWMASP